MRPGYRLIFLVSLWAGMALATSFRPDWQTLWSAAGFVLFFVAALDWVLVKRLPGVVAERRLPHSLPLGVWGDAHIRLTNRANNVVTAEVYDHHPSTMETEGLPSALDVPGEGWTELTYRLLPQERGEQKFAQVDLLLGSPLRLWRKRVSEGEGETVRVYPNFAAVAKYALLATDN